MRAMATDAPPGLMAAYEAFLSTSLHKRLEQGQQATPEDVVLALFQRVAASVPAYQAFLREHGIEPSAIRRFADFQQLPLVTKQNYVTRYPLAELCRGGSLASCDFIAVSS